MATRIRPADEGTVDARRLRDRVGRELRDARIAGGWSQRFIAAAAGMSQSQYSRLEGGRTGTPSLDQICRASRALGLATSLGLHPSGARPRDASQLRLLRDVEALLSGDLRLRREVPLPLTGDLRAWDGMLVAPTGVAFVEAETRLGDLQDLARRLALKQRDDGRSSVIILVVRRTAHNRRILEEHRDALREMFPLDGAAIARHLRSGRLPPASGIILL